MERLLERYQKHVIPELMKKCGYTNVMQIPRLTKIVLNIGVKEARENQKAIDIALSELTAITGQRGIVTRAKKSISNFKLREGLAIGCMVTLRGKRMYEFMDRLISLAIPRIRDFKGVSPKAFDGQGNYNLGITEQHIFPEIDADKSDRIRGMNITFVTSANNVDEAREFLRLMGMPFRAR